MIRGALIDISGVIRIGKTLIPGSVTAFNLLRKSGCKIQFLSNTDSLTHSEYVNLLRSWGFDVKEDEILTAPQAAKEYVLRHRLSPFKILHEKLQPDFYEIGVDCDSEDISGADSVLLGDMGEKLNYTILNNAFRILMKNKETKLISFSRTRYYRSEDGGLNLDVGPFSLALESASGKTPIVCGKPSSTFFQEALRRIHCTKEEVVMIGDDILTDIGAAQEIGIKGILVKTGKYTPADETNLVVKPFLIAENFSDAVDWILLNLEK
eukprot:TRINITY_DN5119_c0_g1_i1.p1 TRINITY_DN5119_c0_g1~~TRINITY_DN5119_c0_g1_i1.p1  ORF type:complete len:287 (-),score=57.69 TRINITY_DN5119_c0_g1_i1:92-889(-)